MVKPWEGGGLAARERASIPLDGVGGARSDTSRVAFAKRWVRDGGGGAISQSANCSRSGVEVRMK